MSYLRDTKTQKGVSYNNCIKIKACYFTSNITRNFSRINLLSPLLVVASTCLKRFVIKGFALYLISFSFVSIYTWSALILFYHVKNYEIYPALLKDYCSFSLYLAIFTIMKYPYALNITARHD